MFTTLGSFVNFQDVHCLLLVLPTLLSCVELMRQSWIDTEATKWPWTQAFVGGLTGPMKSISKGVPVVSKDARTTNQANKAAQLGRSRSWGMDLGTWSIDSWGFLGHLGKFEDIASEDGMLKPKLAKPRSSRGIHRRELWR